MYHTHRPAPSPSSPPFTTETSTRHHHTRATAPSTTAHVPVRVMSLSVPRPCPCHPLTPVHSSPHCYPPTWLHLTAVTAMPPTPSYPHPQPLPVTFLLGHLRPAARLTPPSCPLPPHRCTLKACFFPTLARLSACPPALSQLSPTLLLLPGALSLPSLSQTCLGPL